MELSILHSYVDFGAWNKNRFRSAPIVTLRDTP